MSLTGKSGRKLSALALVMVLTLVGLLGLIDVSPSSDAAEYPTKRDSKGYYYMDSKNPDPKVKYEWVDVITTGTDLYTSSSGSYGYIPLSFEFPFYGVKYTNLYVSSTGYLCFNSWTYTTSYSSGMPLSSTPNPMIAVYWGYCYGNSYYLYGGGGGGSPRWIAIEWNTLYYGHNVEVILYESGVIKMQYKTFGTSGYYNGQSTQVGIEDQTGTVGLMYSTYSDVNIDTGMAIEFSFTKLSFSDIEFDGDGNFENPTAFAEHRYYKLDFIISDEVGSSDLYLTRVYFGPIALGIYAEHSIIGGLMAWTLGGGSLGKANSSIELDLVSSDLETTGFNSTSNHMVLYIMFKFGGLLNGDTDITLWGIGLAALTKMVTFNDMIYVDSAVKTVGEFVAYSESGRLLINEDYTMEKENVTFTGLTLIYNRSRLDDPANYTYPLNSSFYWTIVDDALNAYHQYNASGKVLEIRALMPDKALRRVFKLLVSGNIPAAKVWGGLPEIALKVDDSKPAAPQTFTIRADSFKDTQRTVDNDDTLFVSWSSVKDSGSGVVHYRISDTFDPTDQSLPKIPPKETEFIWNRTVEGIYSLYIWAEDYVGHVGEPAVATIKIDRKDPIFSEFSPMQNELLWVRNMNPEVKIVAYDGEVQTVGTSGIRRTSLEYSISTKGPDMFEEWISADQFDDDTKDQYKVEVKVQPRFVEGTQNLIKFRAMDRAGNGYTVSQSYPLFIDVTEPRYEDFFPTPLVWHDQNVINGKDVSIYIFDDTSGVKTPDIYYRISNKLYSDGSYEWVTGINQTGGWEQLSTKNWERLDGNKKIWVHIPYADFVEGDMNFIQFLTKDVAGNGRYTEWMPDKGPWTVSPLYQILVNTKPVAIISKPKMDQVFLITELITFDASDSYDVDVDKGNLKFEWREGTRVLGYNMVQGDERFKTAGIHTITLFVGDSVHKPATTLENDTRAMATIRINIIEEKVPDPGIDTDGDGIEDWWELKNFLDPRDKKDAGLDFDLDGFNNLREYLGDDNLAPGRGFEDGNDPWDPADHPAVKRGEELETPTTEAPFQVWVFMVLIVVAIILAAAVILIGYLRMNKKEEVEKREEAEEEAMLATPQLEIPSMPMTMIDTSVPTLPSADAAAQPEALPPAPDHIETPASEPVPMAAQPGPEFQPPVQ